MATNPIFLFSLPRSGSTFLQRLLAGHPEIMTVSEPWLLLPLCYALKSEGTFSEYNFSWATRAINEFIMELPNRQYDYISELRSFAITLYGKANKKNARFFLDKTPRYYLIIPEVIEIFPDAKFIFLFRNPLQILGSIIKSLNHNSLCLHEYHIDLYRGPRLLAEGYRKIRNKSIAVDFENLISNPIVQLKRITSYLGIDYTDVMLNAFLNVQFKGTMGDKDGFYSYDKVEANVTEKWRTVLGTKLRKNYAKKYVSKLGLDTLQTLGYSQSDLFKNINELKEDRKRLIHDIVDICAANVFRLTELPLFVKKFRASKIRGSSLVCHR